MNEKWISVSEVRKITRKSPRTICRWTRAKRWATKRTGNKVQYLESDVLKHADIEYLNDLLSSVQIEDLVDERACLQARVDVLVEERAVLQAKNEDLERTTAWLKMQIDAFEPAVGVFPWYQRLFMFLFSFLPRR